MRILITKYRPPVEYPATKSKNANRVRDFSEFIESHDWTVKVTELPENPENPYRKLGYAYLAELGGLWQSRDMPQGPCLSAGPLGGGATVVEAITALAKSCSGTVLLTWGAADIFHLPTLIFDPPLSLDDHYIENLHFMEAVKA